MMKYKNTLVGKELHASGLYEIQTKLLAGESLAPADEARVHAADVLLVSALAEALREHYVGDDVLLHATHAPASDDSVYVVRPSHPDRSRWTGLDFMRRVAHARIVKPRQIAIAVGWDDVGLELAQVALTAGAHVLFGSLPSVPRLPVVGSKGSKAQPPRVEIAGLVQRAGRRPVWVDEPSEGASVVARHEVAG
jgi:hypothetical protein